MLHSFTASDQVTLQVSRLLELCIASWTAESFEECMDFVYVTNMTIISYQLSIFSYFFILRCASSPTIAPPIRSKSYMRILLRFISSTDGISSIQNPLNFEGSVLVLLKRKRLNNFDVFSSNISLRNKCRATALKKQRLSLYGFVVFLSKVGQLTVWFFKRD